jgi:trimethylamine:corrinoid methyltransferase-like protein
MIDLLAADSGGRAALKAKPRAVFDVCPSPPLNWSAFAAQNLVDLAQAWVPAQMVSMPLAGATAPVTLLGAIVQHAAESLSGLTIHQLAQPGAPIVWGGAPAIFDMRWGTTPMGAVETAMITAGYAQIGKHLGLPTHAYLGASDAKIVDAQAGLESGVSAVLGALAGIHESGLNMPRDVALVVFDDLDLFELTVPTITAVAQPAHLMGRRAMQFLKQRIENPDLHLPEVVILPTELVLRDST